VWLRRGLVVAAIVLSARAAGAAPLRFELELPPHGEREVCQYLQVERGRPGMTLAGFRLRLEGHSHHFQLIDATGLVPLATGMRDGSVSACAAGPEYPALVWANGRRLDVRLPPGTRLPWHRPQALVLSFHAVNPSDRPVRARARVRLQLRRPRSRDRPVTVWSLNVSDIFLPPETRARVATETVLERPLTVLTLTGHMHRAGVRLAAEVDGRPWYAQDDWRHPSLRRFSPPLVLPAGTRIRLGCDYDNGVARPVRSCADGGPCPLELGSGVDDAMCVLAGYVVAD
jgi:hypothetical protein